MKYFIHFFENFEELILFLVYLKYEFPWSLKCVHNCSIFCIFYYPLVDPIENDIM